MDNNARGSWPALGVIEVITMSIDENGFLDEDINSWIRNHRNEHRSLFDICQEVNRIAQTNLYKLNVHNQDVQEILLALLFIRALSTYQGSLLPIERGMLTEAKILLRTLGEALIMITYDISRAFKLDLEKQLEAIHQCLKQEIEPNE